ncbi:MAG: styrene monooxygenase/indole monooxygenase family protein [Pseudomonadales bacterium]
MRKITIVGGGQSGLQLAIALLKQDYEVCVVTNRSAEDVRTGRVLSSQCMFGNSLDIERRLKLNFWEEECPNVEGVGLAIVGPEQTRVVDWKYRLTAPAQSTDQRVKVPAWMQHFEEAGGQLVIHDAGMADLESYAKNSDLVIIAAGKGEISQMFERDDERSAFDKPMRALALTYVNGMQAQADFSHVGFNIIPGVGEYFSFPALTTNGPCDIMVFEGIVGGEMDCWQDVKTPVQHLQRSQEILAKYMPWEAARCQNIELTDANGILAGRFPPTVRKPIGRLPSGALVLGMADVVVLNDPITGQGSNNAAKCADVYASAIVNRQGEPFDAAWMQDTFERYWDYAQWVAAWTSGFLLPPAEHVQKLLGAAQDIPRIGQAFVDGFNHPPSYFPWFADPKEADAFIQRHSQAA